jgi:hypothetical protein
VRAMTKRILTGSNARFALRVATASTLAAALMLFLVASWFALGGYIFYLPITIPLMVLQFFIPGFVLLSVRQRLPIPEGEASTDARRIGWATVWVAATGILWLSGGVFFEVIAMISPGPHDLAWYALLAANELARHGVHRGSQKLGLLALFTLGVALELVVALGTPTVKHRSLPGEVLPWLGEACAWVAEHPWAAMIWLAGLWSWVALVDHERPRRAEPTAANGVPCAP